VGVAERSRLPQANHETSAEGHTVFATLSRRGGANGSEGCGPGSRARIHHSVCDVYTSIEPEEPTVEACDGSLSERVQCGVGADIELAVHDGRRGVDRLTQVVLREYFGSIARRQDDHNTVSRTEVDLAVAGHR